MEYLKYNVTSNTLFIFLCACWYFEGWLHLLTPKLKIQRLKILVILIIIIISTTNTTKNNIAQKINETGSKP